MHKTWYSNVWNSTHLNTNTQCCYRVRRAVFTGRFERAITVFDAARDILLYCRNVSAVDSGHSKHVCYTGTYMTLVAQLGCGKTVDIGAAAITGEKKSEYEWIANKMKHFVTRLLDRLGHVNISDRDKGIPGFTGKFSLWPSKCAFHIRKNVYTQSPVRGSNIIHVLYICYTYSCM